jgi:putative ABC transport system permease protein
LGEELAQVPHVKYLESASFVPARVMMNTEDPSEAISAIVLARKFVSPDPPFDLIAGDRRTLRTQLLNGQVVIGSVLAQKTGLKLGDKLPLETSDGIAQVPICGITNEYMSGGMSIHMYRELAEKWLGVEGTDGYSIDAEAGYRDSLQPILDEIAKKHGAVLLSHGQVQRNVSKIIGGVEWSLWAIVVVGFMVAAFGVVNTLTMNVLEQTRELGLLRIVAMTKQQVRRTIFTQALIIGGVGLPPGIAMGVLIAYAMNLVMMPSFGHPIEFQVHPRLLLFTLVGSLTIVFLAAIFPARRATRINVVEALHYE